MRFRLLISLLLLPWSLLVAQTPSKTVSANPGTGELIWPDKETFKLINGIASGMSNPMTAPGDLIVGSIGGAPARLGIGLPGYVLAVNLTADGLVWIPAPTGGGGGSGTVTAFSAGNLAPLFTTAVATPTTTPALSFSLTLQAANRIFAGPVTGAAAAPTFRALVPADVPDLSGIYLTPAAAALAYVPVTRTVNGHALSGDVTVTKADVGLGNVDNTSDANKPISTATQTALNGKASTGPVATSGLTMSTARLLGRTTAAAGAVEEISIGAGLSLNAGVLSATAGATGTVTSVALSLPSIFNVTGSPVTTSGTLAATFTTQAANTIFAGPGSGAAAAPTFRALVLADVPDLSGIYLTPAAAALAYVPVTRTVNGHALSSDVTVTKSDVGLGNVDNTSDANKPIGTATQTALNAKASTGPVATSGLTMSTARLLGRTTAATGAVEEITVSTGLSLNAGVLTATGQAPGNYIIALTGDVTAAGPGSVAATLATVNSNVGSFGSATLIPIITVNAKGLVTNATTVAVTADAGTLTGTTLKSTIVNASLNSITPAGGTLAITGSISATNLLTIDKGTGTPPPLINGTQQIRLLQDDANANGLQADAYNGQTALQLYARRIGGTRAAPSATVAGTIFDFLAYGFTTGLTVAPSGRYQINAKSNWSSTNAETQHVWWSTPLNSLSPSVNMILDSTGLAVTGNISATGSLSSTLSGNNLTSLTLLNAGLTNGNFTQIALGSANNNNNSTVLKFTQDATTSTFGIQMFGDPAPALSIAKGASGIASITSTGLAVTGFITSTQSVTVSNGGFTISTGGFSSNWNLDPNGGNPLTYADFSRILTWRDTNASFAQRMQLTSAGLSVTGNLSVSGSISKGSGTFRIAHPLPSLNKTNFLIHSFIEGPKADLIYRGRTVLVNGKAIVDIDKAVGMTAGTFVALAENPQVWIQNESGPAPVRGAVVGSTLTVESASGVTDSVSWLVIAERHDETIRAADWTNLEGKPVLEPIKVVDPATGSERPENKTDRAQPKGNAAKSVKPAPKKI